MKDRAEKKEYPLRSVIKVSMKKETVFWSNGLMELLQNIDLYSSLRRACDDMELSYSKGHRIIKSAEDALGFDLVESQKGGSNGGTSELTEEGRKFLKCYLMYTEKIKLYAREIFPVHFSDYI